MTSMGAVVASARPRPLRVERDGDRSAQSLLFLVLLWFTVLFAVVFLGALIIDTLRDAIPRFDAALFQNYSSQLEPEAAGLRAAIQGTAWVIGLTALLCIPFGVAAAIYLQEFADTSRWWNRLIELNIQNLAAVPAIIYGMLTAGFALYIGLPRRALLAGAIALALLTLPVIIVATREALKAVPEEIRLGSLALGATPLQTTFRQILPAAVPGIATGTILGLSRALGEAAPLLLLGGLVFVNYDPDSLLSGFTVMPLQIYNWVQLPQPAFREAAAAAIVVLLGLLLIMNSIAILIRNRYQARW